MVTLEKVINGEELSKDEAYTLYDYSLSVLKDIAYKVFEKNHSKTFDFCTIVNAKSGKCSEDCKFCAQSGHYCTNINEYKYDENKILADAKVNYENGIRKYSIVMSGRVCNNVNQVAETVKKLKSLYKDMQICVSVGLLQKNDIKVLKEAGINRIHNNLEASRDYFPKVCTTHTFDEKIQTIKYAKELSIDVCSGGIIGLGETQKDRIDLALELRNLEIKSIPVNYLSPIKGTPLGDVEIVPYIEFLKTLCIFRILNPKAIIRLAGGRANMDGFGKEALECGVNGAITGELLTTYGNSTQKDYEMIKEFYGK